MKCLKCGVELQEGQNFCPSCGQAVSGIRRPEETTQSEGNTSIYTDTEFLAALNELSARDIGAKSVIKFYGTKVMQKELLPLLKPGEKILAICNIHKLNIDKYAKEFLAVTSYRVLEICKGGGVPGSLLPAKVKECQISQILGFDSKKTLIGETFEIKTAASTLKTQLAGKGNAERLKQIIEAQR